MNVNTNNQATALLGISAYRMEFEEYNYIKSTSTNFNNILNHYYTSISSSSPQNFQVLPILVFIALLAMNFTKWAMFGRLTEKEIRIVRDKINYTIWEFFFGFMIFFYESPSMGYLIIQQELIKFAGLFLCVLLLKSFHYLAAERFHSIFSTTDGHYRANSKLIKFVGLRFLIGLVLLNLIDGMLIAKFFYEVYKYYYSIPSQVSFKENILVAIFGFEILHIFPLIVLTSLKYGLCYYEYLKFEQCEEFDVGNQKQSSVHYSQLHNLSFDEELEENHSKWNESRLQVIYVAEFLVNFVRFLLVCSFSIIFLYFYTFPLHILPSSYGSLRVLVDKTRSLVNYKKKQLLLLKLEIPVTSSDEKCIICFDVLDQQNTRKLNNCSHHFHYGCLKVWVNFSNACPICRQGI